MNLEGLITWVVSEGGAMGLAYYAMENIAKLRDIANKELKRIVAFILAGIIADGLYCLAIWLTFRPVPTDAKDWVNTLASVALVAIVGGQLVHGGKDLSPRALARQRNRA